MKTIDDSDRMTPRTDLELPPDPWHMLVGAAAVAAVCIPLLALSVFLVRLGWRLAALVVP